MPEHSPSQPLDAIVLQTHPSGTPTSLDRRRFVVSSLTAGGLIATLPLMAGCASSGGDVSSTSTTTTTTVPTVVPFEATGVTTLNVRPSVHTVEPRGVGGDIVADLLSDGIVPIAIPDLAITARGAIGDSSIVFNEVCLELDLCSFYNEFELGAARAQVPEPFELAAFASTFSGTLSLPLSTESGFAVAEMTSEPDRFDSLEPVDPCPRPYCTSEPITLDGTQLSIDTASFLGEIVVEIDVNQEGEFIGGATATAAVPGDAAIESLFDPALGLELVDLDATTAFVSE